MNKPDSSSDKPLGREIFDLEFVLFKVFKEIHYIDVVGINSKLIWGERESGLKAETC